MLKMIYDSRSQVPKYQNREGSEMAEEEKEVS